MTDPHDHEAAIATQAPLGRLASTATLFVDRTVSQDALEGTWIEIAERQSRLVGGTARVAFPEDETGALEAALAAIRSSHAGQSTEHAPSCRAVGGAEDGPQLPPAAPSSSSPEASSTALAQLISALIARSLEAERKAISADLTHLRVREDKVGLTVYLAALARGDR